MTLLAGPAALPTIHVEHVMGTVVSVHVAAPGVDRAVVTEAVGWLHAMDAMFSTYRPDSEISRLGSGQLRRSGASAQVRFVLDECERLREETDGYFSARINSRLDPSGFVKGWAVQTVADRLAAAGSTNHCVNGGGDVCCAGRPEYGRGWRIGIADPHTPDGLISVVDASGPVAVATSGLAERGAHILDPHTGRAADELASVSVVASDLVTADVYATAGVAMGVDRALAWLEAKPGVSALLVDRTGRQHRIGSWPGNA